MPDQLIQYLPAIYQGAAPDSLLVNLFKSFEKLLLGRDDSAPAGSAGLEEIIADLARYADPLRIPSDFLPWLAGWVGLAARADLDEDRQRRIISQIVPLYRIRGTKHGIASMIRLFTGGHAVITEQEDLEFQIKDHSTIGSDTYLGGPAPHRFDVRFTPSLEYARGGEERAMRDRWLTHIVRWVIDISKPAHTAYTLEVTEPGEAPDTEPPWPPEYGGETRFTEVEDTIEEG